MNLAICTLQILCMALAAAQALVLASPGTSTAQLQGYTFQPTSPRAIPSVAIIGAAKSGTSDLYNLLRQISHQVKPTRLRTKEAKVLVEAGRRLVPGHKDFDEYLQRIGHPCGSSPQHNRTAAGAFRRCMQELVSAHQTNTTSSSSSSQLPLSIDGTTIYLSMPSAIAALKAISNDTKIIVLLRHPVDRAQSLYNHRVDTEVMGILPPRVMNHTLNEWAQLFLTWVDKTPQVKPLLKALAAQQSSHQDPARQAQVYRKLINLNLLGLPPGPLTFRKYNRHGHIARNIFGSALYGGALSVWRQEYFTPGRVMIVDCHHFFAHRLQVMDQVYRFVHGRPLSKAGRYIAQRQAIRNARRAVGVEHQGARLDDAATKQRIEAFYQPHNDALINEVLPALRREGALVVGFDKAPWVSLQQQHH